MATRAHRGPAGADDTTRRATEVEADDARTAPTGVSERRWRLFVLSGTKKGKVINLPEQPGAVLRVGKASENDLVLGDAKVSRRHCEIVREGERWLVRDLDSTNGTFVEEAQVRESWLRPGATLRFGDVVLRLAIDHAPVRLAPSDGEAFGALRGKSLRMREIFALLERVSPTDSTVLLTGETGTGKGAVARAIHGGSRRAHGPFVVVDCGAVAPTLIESELFGHERGAFTGAEQRRLGALELAAGGTLFLDELDDLPKTLQPKLLRALEERAFQRVGSGQPLAFDARVVAATKRDLRRAVSDGTFREDLYFRLAVFRVDLPPLRSRRDDLPALVDHFAHALGAGAAWESLPEEVRTRLRAHDWPGNLRELRNAVERALALSQGDAASAVAWHLEDAGVGGGDPDWRRPFKEAKERVVDAFEREYLMRLLDRCEGKITRAAREAGLDRSYFYELLAKHGLADGRA